MLKFSKDHEWVRLDGDIAKVGISDYAQKQLGDVVFVELPDVGREVEVGDEMAVVESVKAASEVYAPIAGEVIEVNANLESAPETVNSTPTEGGWFVKIGFSDKSALDDMMDEAAYKEYCEGL